MVVYEDVIGASVVNRLVLIMISLRLSDLQIQVRLFRRERCEKRKEEPPLGSSRGTIGQSHCRLIK